MTSMVGRLRTAGIAALSALALVAATSSQTQAAPAPQQERIVGGGPAAIEQLPYMAGIFFKGKYGCAGSVIGPRHILTAAHCVIGPATDYTVVTGRTNLSDGTVGQVIPVVQTFVSPDYKKGRGKSSGHDLAVFALASPTTAPPIAVATEAEGAAVSAPGSAYGTAGWGVTNPFKNIPSVGQLKLTFMNAVSNKRCKPYRKDFKPLTMICTLGGRLVPGSKRSFRTSPCSGDSGGPLGATTPGGPRIIGVVSYGPNLCGLPPAPAVFARAYDTAARAFIATAVFTPLPPPV